MRRVAVALLLSTVGVAVCLHAGGATTPGALPAIIGDVSGWTVVSGEFDSAGARGRYRFYVSPGLQGIYRLMRYDVQITARGNDLERARQPGERLVFVRQPGTREPLMCWERDEATEPGTWRAVPPGTDAYRLEMMTLVRILAVHRAVRRESGR